MTNGVMVEKLVPPLSYGATRDIECVCYQGFDILVPLMCLVSHCQMCGNTMQILLVSHLQSRQRYLHLHQLHVHVIMNHRILRIHIMDDGPVYM